MKGCLEEFELAGRLRAQDVDREIAFTLLSQAYAFDRWEIDQVIAYVVHASGLEVGRLVIAPGMGIGSPVRLREHHTLLEQPQQDSLRPGSESPLHAEFANLCQHIRQTLQSLRDTEEPNEVEKSSYHLQSVSTTAGMSRHTNGTAKDSDHFAFPWSKRLEIVQHYRLDRINGEVRNKDQWARRNYQISGRTLFNYECEFPQAEEWAFDPSIAGMATQE